MTEPLGPHRSIPSSVNLTGHVESPRATANFVCTAWFRVLRPIAHWGLHGSAGRCPPEGAFTDLFPAR